MDFAAPRRLVVAAARRDRLECLAWFLPRPGPRCLGAGLRPVAQVDMELDANIAIDDLRDIDRHALMIGDHTMAFGGWHPQWNLKQARGVWIGAAAPERLLGAL